MILDEFGRPAKTGTAYGDIAARMLLTYAEESLKTFSKPLAFPGESLILDAKGVPFSHGKKGGTIKFRRYGKFKI